MSGETLHVYFLGTAGALPTPVRNPSCIMIRRGSDTLLFDCGEGAQQQMMRSRCGFTVNAVFISHWHADHFLGLFGLIQTMSFNGRTEPLTIYGPEWVHEFVTILRQVARFNLKFSLDSVELERGSWVRFDGYTVTAFSAKHGLPSLGYILEEDPRPGRFNREQAIGLGVPPGPLFGRLQRGESEAERGAEFFHATAAQAGEAASVLNARTLVLIHTSSRYPDAQAHISDARKKFSGTIIAPNDLDMIEVGFRDEI
jgi:ribonuclease Z